jgi:hypothetical protein
VGKHPGLHRDFPVLGSQGMQVDTADDVVVTWLEEGEGGTGTAREAEVPALSSSCLRSLSAIRADLTDTREGTPLLGGHR